MEDAVIPSGATLIQATGTGGDPIYYAVYQVYGVWFVYEIGDPDRFRELFPSGVEAFENFQRLTQQRFRNLYLEAGSGFEAGLIDELSGDSRDLAAQVRDQLFDLGFEDIPAWMRESPQAMLIVAQGAKEQWSAGRVAVALSQTDAFQARYSAFDTVAGLIGSTEILTVMDAYAQIESSIRASLRTWRGPDADTSYEYINQLINTGWNPDELDTVLEGEFMMRNNPEAWANLNRILEYQGEQPVTREEFLDLITGRAPGEAIASINDALRFAALEQQGVMVDPELAAQLGSDEELGLLNPEALTQIATQAAQAILRFGLELEAGKLGITRDAIVTAAFGEAGSAETNELLARFARDRALAAQGIGAAQSFVNTEGRLVVQGLKGL